jgi:glutathione S-transferase
LTDSTTFAVLITMPHSHYAEKARWALDWLAMPYREETHVPLLHRLATGRNAGRSVPVLVDGSRRFVDSTEILLHVDAACGGDRLYPRDPALRHAVEVLEEQFDEALGPHTRRWAYAQLLPDRGLLRKIMSRGVSRVEATLLTVIMPIVIPVIRRAFRITPESAQRSIERVRGVFKEVDERLGDGRRFLVGERFTAADLTFAALAGPVLLPACGRAAYPAIEEVPDSMRAEVLRLRSTRAGQFALRLFSEERGRRPESPMS